METLGYQGVLHNTYTSAAKQAKEQQSSDGVRKGIIDEGDKACETHAATFFKKRKLQVSSELHSDQALVLGLTWAAAKDQVAYIVHLSEPRHECGTSVADTLRTASAAHWSAPGGEMAIGDESLVVIAGHCGDSGPSPQEAAPDAQRVVNNGTPTVVGAAWPIQQQWSACGCGKSSSMVGGVLPRSSSWQLGAELASAGTRGSSGSSTGSMSSGGSICSGSRLLGGGGGIAAAPPRPPPTPTPDGWRSEDSESEEAESLEGEQVLVRCVYTDCLLRSSSGSAGGVSGACARDWGPFAVGDSRPGSSAGAPGRCRAGILMASPKLRVAAVLQPSWDSQTDCYRSESDWKPGWLPRGAVLHLSP